MEVIYYPSNLDCYKQGNIVSWARANGLDYIVELHRNAGGGVGYETLVKGGADATDAAIHNAVVGLGFVNRGVKLRNDLANMNRINGVCSYMLSELGFIDNAGDNAIFDNQLKAIGEAIYRACESTGRNKIGIIYGHGQGDPGAVSFGRTEAEDVRKIKVEKGVSTEKYPIPTPNFTLTDGEYMFNNLHLDKVIECDLSNGNAILNHQYGETNQVLSFDSKTKRLIVTIKKKAGDLKLALEMVWGDGVPLKFEGPHSGEFQKYQIQKVGQTSLGYPIVVIYNLFTGRVLAPADFSGNNWTNIVGQKFGEGNAQKWILYPVSR